MTGKPSPFLYWSRSNCSDNRGTSRHRSPYRTSHTNSKPQYSNNNFKPLSCSGSPYPRPQDFPYNKSNCNNSYTNNSRLQSPNYN